MFHVELCEIMVATDWFHGNVFLGLDGDSTNQVARETTLPPRNAFPGNANTPHSAQCFT